jgi:hypothetical protein
MTACYYRIKLWIRFSTCYFAMFVQGQIYFLFLGVWIGLTVLSFIVFGIFRRDSRLQREITRVSERIQERVLEGVPNAFMQEGVPNAFSKALQTRSRRCSANAFRDLEVVCQIMIPRCVYGNLIGKPKCSLHGFGDASLKAYCAVVYYVCELSCNYHVELLTSKTRVAPIKAQTIPR